MENIFTFKKRNIKITNKQLKYYYYYYVKLQCDAAFF